MSMDVFQKQGISIVVPGVARLDASQATGLRESLKTALEKGNGNLVLDLDSVTLMDSIILGVVAGVFRELPEHGHLVLCTVGDNVASLLRLTHLDRILASYGTREEALTALS